LIRYIENVYANGGKIRIDVKIVRMRGLL